jgi:cell division protease FtsH
MAGDDKRKLWQKPEKDKDCGPQEKPPLIGPFDRGQFRFSIWYFLLVVLGIMLINSLLSSPPGEIVDYSTFKELIRAGEIRKVEIGQSFYTGFVVAEEGGGETDQTVRRYRTAIVDDPGLIGLMDEQGVAYYAVPTQNRPLLGMLFSWIVPFALLALVWRYMFRRMGGGGADVLSFGRNRAQIVAEGETGVRFADVAGADEAKAELEEVVDFLKTPEKYTAIGGKIPKGLLMVGAPGTGKTLLARAVAGEAGVPFFRMSGADFVEMFVGVGAARVRDLFKQARSKAPCIIFIDELDAIGKSRASAMGSNDEREQTLNQLLVEMDGFDARTGVIILAATNRPEILDPALMRPGRFDRQVVVDKPDLSGREAILRIHAQEVKMDETVDLAEIARATPGFVGADLANLVNEAALMAVREGRQKVTQSDFDEAVEKLIAGLEKKNKLISPSEKRIVAYHEVGHALVAHSTPGSDPVQKISIVPRGMSALGYTLQRPSEERYLLSEEELLGRIDVLLGGRAAEEIVFDRVSTGAANDLIQATDIANRMITEYGMSARFRNVHLPFRKRSVFLGDENYAIQREYSESTQQYIDEETARIIDERYQAVLATLREQEPLLREVADKLLEVETIDRKEFENLVAAPV